LVAYEISLFILAKGQEPKGDTRGAHFLLSGNSKCHHVSMCSRPQLWLSSISLNSINHISHTSIYACQE
jgi:hypothetical protein